MNRDQSGRTDEEKTFEVEGRDKYRLFALGKVKLQPYEWNGEYWEAISQPAWRKAAKAILEVENPELAGRIRSADIDDEFGDLVVDEINDGTQAKILQSDGTVIDLDEFLAAGAGAKIEAFTHPAANYFDQTITMKFGAHYIVKAQRMANDAIMAYLREMIADPDGLKFLVFIICHALTGRISVKAILTLLNFRFNTGKSTAMSVLFALFGKYAVKIAPQLFHRENVDRLIKFFWVHKDFLLFIIDETDPSFRPEVPSLKRLTGGDLFPNSYNSTAQDQFKVRAMLMIDSNEIIQVQTTAGSLQNRLFLLPFGRPIPRDQRIWGLEKTLTTPENLDTFFSNLLDDHFAWAMSNPLPVKPRAMQDLDLLARLRQDRITLFLEHCTRATESNATMGAQNYNTLEIHKYFVRFSKRLYRALLERVGFNLDENAEPMDFHQITMELPVEDHREFKTLVDRIMGEANELDRSNKGYRWTTFVLKEMVVMYLDDPRLESIFGPMDELIDKLDGMKTDLDAVKAVEGHLNTMVGLHNIQFNGFADPDLPSAGLIAYTLLNPPKTE
ncbi:MAG: hypothetical protein WCG80_06740 [Spirochaetales bacterium]